MFGKYFSPLVAGVCLNVLIFVAFTSVGLTYLEDPTKCNLRISRFLVLTGFVNVFLGLHRLFCHTTGLFQGFFNMAALIWSGMAILRHLYSWTTWNESSLYYCESLPLVSAFLLSFGILTWASLSAIAAVPACVALLINGPNESEELEQEQEIN